MSILSMNFVKSFIRMSDDGYKKGWHERNGGNLTYRLTKSEAEEVLKSSDISKDAQWKPIGIEGCLSKLSGELFLVTGSGKFFRNIEPFPAASLGIIEVDSEGKNYRILWGLENGGVPTSELPSHLMNHEAKITAKGDDYRIIYHCHTVNIIALTFILPLESEIFTRELWQMITECPLVFPDGVGVMPWMIPGGREIAEKSSELMREFDVIVWAHHGIFCAGTDFDTTFGLADTIEKAAEVLMKILSVSETKRQTIADDNFVALAKAFNVELSDKFLK